MTYNSWLSPMKSNKQSQTKASWRLPQVVAFYRSCVKLPLMQFAWVYGFQNAVK